ncbi:purine-binding chemotaxis protein CheW [Permianibacter sp. IMCC34836]|uniref:chemotaxis protein CheW n=1 Tax=Permianibacter fluminis TaxID=2738515 RepID=UPI001554687A|nr:chemotaxis protein CheW [Permianibacter fluminis]NQD35802.1 purine-binding chemotaxis protein CheW [Permianibacter fluminis]
MSTAVDPFLVLADLDARCRQGGAATAPRMDEQGDGWSGVAFILNGVRMVAPLGEVTEILHLPHTTKVPGARAWLRGVANVRGSLVPIADLPMFFGRRQGATGKRQRVLVINHDQNQIGIIVDDVLGLQHFTADQRQESPGDIDETLRPYVLGAFSREENLWPVFSPQALTRHASFKQVAL